jgi:hypothetical protein
MMQGIPPELLALLQGQQAVPTQQQNPIIAAIQNAMAKRTRSDMSDLQTASLPQGIREDDPRNYYPPITPESIATDEPPPPPQMTSRSTGLDTEDSYDERPGEDKAARMAADAVEGRGTKYPNDNHDPTDANQLNDRGLQMHTEALAAIDDPSLAKEFEQKYGLTPQEWMDSMEGDDYETTNAYQPKGVYNERGYGKSQRSDDSR